MSMGLKAFSHVIFDEYICVALSEGILIPGKEDLTCVEILYGWVVGFDEVLVAESNMTKISKLKRWFSLEKNSIMSKLGEASTILCIESLLARCLVSRACPVGSAVRRGWNGNIVEGMMM
ncbi:hypothetical protein Tco_0910171 [Tanacetum coccineum]|uniref:Uncharacterized protein n=1 Tax=Tanacetum coccineum TaxID=301880 RepID=A0ABQ5CVH4_9ASTR